MYIRKNELIRRLVEITRKDRKEFIECTVEYLYELYESYTKLLPFSSSYVAFICFSISGGRMTIKYSFLIAEKNTVLFMNTMTVKTAYWLPTSTEKARCLSHTISE